MADYKTDANGFPVETCRRCGGAGTIPGFYHVLNGVCFDCNGARNLYPKGKPAALALAFNRDYRAARRCTLTTGITYDATGAKTYHHGAAVGDLIKRPGDDVWREVTSIRTTARMVGWGMTGHPQRISHVTLSTIVVLDGTERIEAYSIECRRKLNAAQLAEWTARRDADAAAARKLYEQRLKRRGA